MIGPLRGRLNRGWLLGDSPVASWLRGAGWLFSSSLIERAAALLQTIVIARTIGIEPYGRYGLLFSTIGLMTPLIALQLPYAIVYFVSRFRAADPARAGAVVLLARWLTIVTSVGALLLAIPFAVPLSGWLFHSDGYGNAIILGAVILLASVQAGLSDSLLQANERFRTLALARLSTAVFAFVIVAAAAYWTHSLIPVLAALAIAALARLAAVAIPARRISNEIASHSDLRSALRQGGVILHFALPSGLLSLAQGVAAWIGFYYLARTATGLRDVAAISTGMQWRSPILVVMTALASALLPMLGRYLGEDNKAQTHRLQRYNMILNVGVSLAFSLVVILAGPWILHAYGDGFGDKWLVFALFVGALVPAVYCNVHQQYLVATGRMWAQFLLFVPFTAIHVIGTLWYARVLDGAKLGYIQLAGWVVTAALITAVVAIDRRRDRLNAVSGAA